MTDEQKQTVENWLASGHHAPTTAQVVAIMALLDAYDAVHPIVVAVANGATTYRDREDEYCTQDPNCMWRRPGIGQPMRFVHTDRCIATKAQAIIAAESGDSEVRP